LTSRKWYNEDFYGRWEIRIHFHYFDHPFIPTYMTGNKAFRKLVGRSPGKPGKIKTAHARGRGLRRKKELDETARKLNLRKLENFFFSTTVSLGDKKLKDLDLPECSGTSVSGGGVSWTGERCTVHCEDT
jgi:hypothetical protein